MTMRSDGARHLANETVRNVHCSNCGDTRGGPVGHEISECTFRRARGNGAEEERSGDE
jgi:hypothetical protein